MRGKSRLEARVGFLAEQTKELEHPSEAGGRFSLTAFGLWACHEVAGPAPSLDVCGGLETGILHAEGFGVTDPGEAAPAWLSLTPSLVGTMASEQLAFCTFEPVSGPTPASSSLRVGALRGRHRASWLIGRMSIGPEIDFP